MLKIDDPNEQYICADIEISLAYVFKLSSCSLSVNDYVMIYMNLSMFP